MSQNFISQVNRYKFLNYVLVISVYNTFMISLCQFGRQTFILQGQGVCPSAMDPITITAGVKSSRMQMINFTNPLDVATHFSVSLKGQDVEHFCLLMKRTNSILLHPGVSLDIPVMFAPEVMCGHKADVIVVSDESYPKNCTLCWCYPVIGQPELRVDLTSKVLNLKCRAKERSEHEFSVPLMNSLDKVDSTAVESTLCRTGL